MPPKASKSKDAPAERPILGRFSSHLKIGIVGLPNVGKSTLFNTLTKLSIPAENFPFCTIEPNEARVNVPDERFEWLLQLFKPKSEVSAFLEIHDIAGLVRGAHQGQGLGNSFLSHIRAVDGIFHVLRAFDDPDIIHVDDSIDPVRDLETISEELRLKDIEFMENKLEDLEKSMKRSNDKQLKLEHECCQKIKAWLEEGKDVRSGEWKAADVEILNTFQLLSAKPVVYLVNMTERDYQRKKNKFLPKIHAWVQEHGGEPIIPFSGVLERNLADLPEDEAAKYCEENKVQSALTKIIKTGFSAINLIYFFTAGPDEVKCWQIRRQTKAPQAAGTIHTDFERGFICAELIAGGIVIGVILHGGTHLACDLPRITGSNRRVFLSILGGAFGNKQPSYIQVLCTTEVATGVVMVILMAIAFTLATRVPRRQSRTLPSPVRQITGYNTFWYSHHLLIIVYILLIIHSMFLFLTNSFAEKSTWMYLAVPVLLYSGERLYRSIRSDIYEVDVLKAIMHPGKVLQLQLSKPTGFTYRSGMYIYIKCPQISPFEWHPFSLTSAPSESHLSVHIRTLGDWSYEIHDLFQETLVRKPFDYPKVYIDGPYGAASQDHVKYNVVVMIGLGIGATPFISVLKDIKERLSKPIAYHENDLEAAVAKDPLKAYLYWVTREQGSLNWFRDDIKQLSETSQQQKVTEIHNFLTSVYQSGDARSVLLSIIQVLYHAKTGIDIFSQTKVQTHFSRPDWLKIFSKLARRHPGSRIGVFYCGSSNLARELDTLCTNFSTKTTSRFVFHKENY